MKKVCAEFDIAKKTCSMIMNDKMSEANDFMIGKYSYSDSEGKKQTCSYASFAMKDKEGIDCSYVITHDSKSGETTVSKNGYSVLASIKETLDINKLISKVSVIFSDSKSTTIPIDKMIQDVFEMNDSPRLVDPEKC